MNLIEKSGDLRRQKTDSWDLLPTTAQVELDLQKSIELKAQEDEQNSKSIHICSPRSFTLSLGDQLGYGGGCENRSKKLIIIMVGLPGSGKSYMSKKVSRYFTWLGFSTKIFNVGTHIRKVMGKPMSNAEFFNNDPQKVLNRECFALVVLDEAINFLLNHGGNIAIHDATNSVVSRRKKIEEKLAQHKDEFDVVWIESIVNDAAIKESNINLKATSPDYEGVPEQEAIADFKRRLAYYEEKYEPLDTVKDNSLSFIKMIDGGRDYIIHNVFGAYWYQSQLKTFLLNYSLKPVTMWMSRHGQSAWNSEQRIGGNPDLSAHGKRYARALAKFVELHEDLKQAQILTSCLARTHQTVRHCPNVQCMKISLLNEINAGLCEGMTYEEIKQNMPEVHAGRSKDKLSFRYPGGESYIDILYRLQPLIIEFERTHKPYFIVAHQAILRVILAYFYTLENKDIPFLEVPLHTLFKFESTHFGYNETQYEVDLDLFEKGEEIFWTETKLSHTR